MSLERRIKRLEERAMPKDVKPLIRVVESEEEIDKDDNRTFYLIGIDLSGYPQQEGEKCPWNIE